MHVGFSTLLLALHVGRHLERREEEPSSGPGIRVSEKITGARLLPRISEKSFQLSQNKGAKDLQIKHQKVK